MHCGPSIDISNNGHNATFSSSESWSTVLGNVGFMIGKNHWKIRIERSPTAYLFVGIATKDANLSTFLGGDENGWGYIGDRALYHKRNKVKLYGERFGQGDVIGVTLDMDEGTLSFDKNGEDLGVAITNLVGVIYPAVAFYNRGQQVQILHQRSADFFDDEDFEYNSFSQQAGRTTNNSSPRISENSKNHANPPVQLRKY